MTNWGKFQNENTNLTPVACRACCLDTGFSKSLLLCVSVEYCCLQQFQTNTSRMDSTKIYLLILCLIVPRNVLLNSPLIQINDLDVSSPPLCKFEICLAGRLIDPVYPVSNSVNYLLYLDFFCVLCFHFVFCILYFDGRLIDPVYPVSNSVNYLPAFPLFQTFIAASL